MKRLILTSLLFVLVVACDHKDKGFMPERLFTEEEMVDIMTDVQIIEAEINYQKSLEREDSAPDTDYKAMAQSYYDQFFEHHGITDTLFLQNIKYYTERPEVLKRIMDSVVQRLTREPMESRKDDSQ